MPPKFTGMMPPAPPLPAGHPPQPLPQAQEHQVSDTNTAVKQESWFELAHLDWI